MPKPTSRSRGSCRRRRGRRACARRPAAGLRAARRRPRREDDEAGGDQADRARRGPAPLVRVGDRQQRQDEPDRQQPAPGRRRGPGVRRATRAPRSRSRTRPRPPSPRRSRRSSGRRPGRSAGRRRRGPGRRRCRRSPRSSRCSVATRSRGNSSRMIPKQSGKMPPPSPCSTRPATTPSIVPERPNEVARGEDAQRDHEHPALAEHVAQAPEERGRDGRGEQVAGQRPGHARRRGVQLAAQHAECGDQHRLGQRERQRGEREQPERARGVRAGVGVRHRDERSSNRTPRSG